MPASDRRLQKQVNGINLAMFGKLSKQTTNETETELNWKIEIELEMGAKRKTRQNSWTVENWKRELTYWMMGLTFRELS